MAGGLGTRLRPITEDIPKPLVPVGGKPVLETIIEQLAVQGFTGIFLAVNYLADQVRAHFGDGSRWGVRIDYLEEETRLGTAGALTLLPERPQAPFLVMNADLVTDIDFRRLLGFHELGCERQVDLQGVRRDRVQLSQPLEDVAGHRIEGFNQQFFLVTEVIANGSRRNSGDARHVRQLYGLKAVLGDGINGCAGQLLASGVSVDDLGHAVQGRFRGCVPGGKPGADVDAAAPQTSKLLRPGY